MFPDDIFENKFIQIHFSVCAFTQSFFENNVKFLPCVTTESNFKPDENHFYSQKIFSFGGNLSKLPTVLGAWDRQRAIIFCFGPKFGPRQRIILR